MFKLSKIFGPLAVAALILTACGGGQATATEAPATEAPATAGTSHQSPHRDARYGSANRGSHRSTGD